MTEDDVFNLKKLSGRKGPKAGNHVYPVGNRFRVTMRALGKTRYFGTFDTVEEAAEKVKQVQDAIALDKVGKE